MTDSYAPTSELAPSNQFAPVGLDVSRVDRNLRRVSELEFATTLPPLPDLVKMDLIQQDGADEDSITELLLGLDDRMNSRDDDEPMPGEATMAPQLPRPAQTGLDQTRIILAAMTSNPAPKAVTMDAAKMFKLRAIERGMLDMEPSRVDNSWSPEFNRIRGEMAYDDYNRQLRGDRPGAMPLSGAMKILNDFTSPAGLLNMATELDLFWDFGQIGEEISSWGDKFRAWADADNPLDWAKKGIDALTGPIDDIVFPIVNVGLMFVGAGAVVNSARVGWEGARLAEGATLFSRLWNGGRLGRFADSLPGIGRLAETVAGGARANLAELGRASMISSRLSRSGIGGVKAVGDALADWRALRPVIAGKQVMQQGMRLGFVSAAEQAFPGYQSDGLSLDDAGVIDYAGDWLNKAAMHPGFMPLELMFAPYNIFSPGTFFRHGVQGAGAVSSLARGAAGRLGSTPGRMVAGAGVGALAGTLVGDDAGDIAKGAAIGAAGAGALPVLGRALEIERVHQGLAGALLGAGAGAIIGEEFGWEDVALGAIAGVGIQAIPNNVRRRIYNQAGINGLDQLLRGVGHAMVRSSFLPIQRDQEIMVGFYQGVRRTLLNSPDELAQWETDVSTLGVIGALAKRPDFGGDMEVAAAAITYGYASMAADWIATAQAKVVNGGFDEYKLARNKIVNQLRPIDIGRPPEDIIADVAKAVAVQEHGGVGGSLEKIYARRDELIEILTANPEQAVKLAEQHNKLAGDTILQLFDQRNFPDPMSAGAAADGPRNLLGNEWAGQSARSRRDLFADYSSDYFNSIGSWGKFTASTDSIRQARAAGLFDDAAFVPVVTRRGQKVDPYRRGGRRVDPAVVKANEAIGDVMAGKGVAPVVPIARSFNELGEGDEALAAFRALGDDEIVTVYHGTSAENAASLVATGEVRPGRPPTREDPETLERVSVSRAWDTEALYVGSNVDAGVGYGPHVVAIDVRKGDLRMSPEAQNLGGFDDVADAMFYPEAGAMIPPGTRFTARRVSSEAVSRGVDDSVAAAATPTLPPAATPKLIDPAKVPGVDVVGSANEVGRVTVMRAEELTKQDLETWAEQVADVVDTMRIVREMQAGNWQAALDMVALDDAFAVARLGGEVLTDRQIVVMAQQAAKKGVSRKNMKKLLAFARHHGVPVSSLDTTLRKMGEDLAKRVDVVAENGGLGRLVFDEQGRRLTGIDALERRLVQLREKAQHTAAELDLDEMLRRAEAEELGGGTMIDEAIADELADRGADFEAYVRQAMESDVMDYGGDIDAVNAALGNFPKFDPAWTRTGKVRDLERFATELDDWLGDNPLSVFHDEFSSMLDEWNGLVGRLGNRTRVSGAKYDQLEALQAGMEKRGYKLVHGTEFLMPEDLSFNVPTFNDVTRRHMNAVSIGNWFGRRHPVEVQILDDRRRRLAIVKQLSKVRDDAKATTPGSLRRPGDFDYLDVGRGPGDLMEVEGVHAARAEFEALPDDALVTVYHGTSREQAAAIVSGRQIDPTATSPRGKPTLHPGELHVAPTRNAASRYGDGVVAIRVPKSALRSPGAGTPAELAERFFDPDRLGASVNDPAMWQDVKVVPAAGDAAPPRVDLSPEDDEVSHIIETLEDWLRRDQEEVANSLNSSHHRGVVTKTADRIKSSFTPVRLDDVGGISKNRTRILKVLDDIGLSSDEAMAVYRATNEFRNTDFKDMGLYAIEAYLRGKNAPASFLKALGGSKYGGNVTGRVARQAVTGAAIGGALGATAAGDVSFEDRLKATLMGGGLGAVTAGTIAGGVNALDAGKDIIQKTEDFRYGYLADGYARLRDSMRFTLSPFFDLSRYTEGLMLAQTAVPLRRANGERIVVPLNMSPRGLRSRIAKQVMAEGEQVVEESVPAAAVPTPAVAAVTSDVDFAYLDDELPTPLDWGFGKGSRLLGAKGIDEAMAQFANLPDDAVITVYHGTSQANADELLRTRTVNPDLVGSTSKARGPLAGDLYVAPSPEAARMYSRIAGDETVVAIQVRRGDLHVAPESGEMSATEAFFDPVTDGLVVKDPSKWISAQVVGEAPAAATLAPAAVVPTPTPARVVRKPLSEAEARRVAQNRYDRNLAEFNGAAKAAKDFDVDAIDSTGQWFRQVGILGFSPTDWMATAFAHLRNEGMSVEDAYMAAKGAYQYGTRGRSAAELSVNFIMFPFSFQKKALGHIGKWMNDDLGRSIIIHDALKTYEQLDEKYNLDELWKDHVPFLQQLGRLNLFAYGISAGRLGGINSQLSEGLGKIALNAFLPVGANIRDAAAGKELQEIGRQLLPVYNDINWMTHDIREIAYPVARGAFGPMAAESADAQVRDGYEEWNAYKRDFETYLADKGYTMADVRNPDWGLDDLNAQYEAKMLEIQQKYPAWWDSRMETPGNVIATNMERDNRIARVEFGLAAGIRPSPDDLHTYEMQQFIDEQMELMELMTGETKLEFAPAGIWDEVKRKAVELAQINPGFVALWNKFWRWQWGPIDIGMELYG